MKLASIFFKASAEYIRGLPQIPYKRARNIKLASIFFKASAEYIRGFLKYTEKQSKGTRNEVYY